MARSNFWSALIVSDVHLRFNPPRARADDFVKAVKKKVRFIQETAERIRVPVLAAGDIFHVPKPSLDLLAWAVGEIRNWVVVAGQHDLPGHSKALLHKSGLGVLQRAGRVRVLTDGEAAEFTDLSGADWKVYGVTFGDSALPRPDPGVRSVLLIHRFTYLQHPPFPGAENLGDDARSLLKKAKGFDLVVTGDNHQTFTYEKGGRVLINPGSVLRMTADQEDHVPSAFLWSAKTNKIRRVTIPHEPGAITREHLESQTEKTRIGDAFLQALAEHSGEDAERLFTRNLKLCLEEERAPSNVRKIVWELINAADERV